MNEPERTILAHTPELMIVSFVFKMGDEGALHSHPHTQSCFIRSGRFMFTIDGESVEAFAGDAFIIPSGVSHGCTCLEDGELIDNFTPRRDDFL